MASTGLLVLSNPARVGKLLPIIGENVLKTLYVQYFPGERSVNSPEDRSSCTSGPKAPYYAGTVANIYAIASTFPNLPLDVRVLLTTLKNSSMSVINTRRPIELVIFDRAYGEKEANGFVQNCLANARTGCKVLTINDDGAKTVAAIPENAATLRTEPVVRKNVVLGGTFDRLHEGHKILLSEALLRCTEKLTIGVTDGNMLHGKILWELIEPCDKRMRDLRDFLEDVDSTTNYDIVPITDMYGPTRWDPSLEMLVVSEETVRGGAKVNDERRKNGLTELDIHVVKLAEEGNRASEHEETKISSRNRRMRLLGTRLKEVEASAASARPYIVGLTGGIASGKSSIAQKLSTLGAGLVDCDRIAHDLYEPGERCFELIVENFGRGILRRDGKIDRKALGDMVFRDRDQLDRLNRIVWPAILDEASRKIEQLGSDGFKVVVMEAAVLIQAKWQFVCQEIWTCVIPHDEAVRRIMERNSLNEKEAALRIDAQPSNVQQIAEATVVFSTAWSRQETMRQVQRAWNELQSFLGDEPRRVAS